MEEEAEMTLDGIDNFFDAGAFHFDDSFLMAPLPAADAESPVSDVSDPNPVSQEAVSLSEIEKILMEDGGEDAGAELGFDAEEFFEAVFASDGDVGSGCGSGASPNQTTGSSEVLSPADASGSDEDRSKEKGEVAGPVAAGASEEIDGDDPISKKKRRQMRNRDSAMQSRERKKMYVKDLEMKSKFLEAEVRRLNYALQCYAAENVTLRQNLQKERSICASAAKQESAVLSETLPLVSLLWLVSIVCLFLMPGLPSQNAMAPTPGSHESELEMAAEKRSNDEPNLRELVLQRRSCKGVRTRMRLSSFPFPVMLVT